MQDDTEQAPIEYPPAPWHARGAAWWGLFQADVALPPLPSGLQPLLLERSRAWVVVALIRYLEGTLRYDELIVGTFARRGGYVGLYVRQIWVDDLASLWGGRRIWGLDKQLATFRWHGSCVQVADAHGPIATLSVDARTALLPRLPLVMPALGNRDGRWLWTLARTSARLGRAQMRLHDWSERFGYQLPARPLLAIGGKPMRSLVPPPTALGRATGE